MQAYVVTMSLDDDNMHNPYKTLFLLDIDVAKRLCSDPRTKGQNHALFYFEKRDDEEQEKHFKLIKDDGRYKEILDEILKQVYF